MSTAQKPEALPATPPGSSPRTLPNTVDSLLHRLRDIEDCERKTLPTVISAHSGVLLEAAKRLVETAPILKSQGEGAAGSALRDVIDATRKLNRIVHARPYDTLREALFLDIFFAAFDTFTGEFLLALFESRPELMKRLGGQVAAAHVVAAKDLDELRKRLLYERIEEHRRKSYVKQFEWLEGLFGLTLREFENWPAFVEVAQRRNLFAHCGGIVTDQYLDVCKGEGHISSHERGALLTLNRDYLLQACSLTAEVAVKLCHTLWRKIMPNDLEAADKHLHGVVYESLQFEEWSWASRIANLRCYKSSTRRNKIV